MNKFFLFTICSALLLVSCKQSSIKRTNEKDMMSAQISFVDSIHDFGSFPLSTPYHEYNFIFTNSGDVPAVILHATPSCQCTSVKYSKEPIMPGKKGVITVAYDGNKNSLGYFDKSVQVRINSSKGYKLRIKGEMTRH